MKVKSLSKDYAPLARASRLVAIVSYVALLLLFSCSTVLFPSCGRQPNWVIWLLHMLPLLLFLSTLIGQNPRSYVWLAFISLGYFAVSVTSVFGCAGLLAVLEVLLICSLFIAATCYVRWRSRELRQQQWGPTGMADNSSENG